ncbi:MAG: carboxypeptidase-like regulatory domain-containing protein, partial [Bacteroidota bacterium]|nr:carboxypeptidase-like regulatory domain-containing protein [Bacteroidota bacterium]
MRNLLLSIVILLAMPLAMYAQRDSTVTVRLENVTLREAIQDIQDNSKFRFFYNDDLPVFDTELSLRLRRASIDQVLDSLLVDTELSYQILEDKLIVISSDEGFGRHEVSGRVIAAENGEPIIGAHVSIKGTSTGTTTDPDGKFNILVPGGETVLLFSYIGYEIFEIPAGGLTNIEVSLKEGAQALKEVVVTALNISREKSSL